MCVSIGYLIFILPLVLVVGAFLGYKYGKRVLADISDQS